MKIAVAVETKMSRSVRARQVGAMFDAPVEQKCRLEWNIDFPIEELDWNVGLVVGPSGSGKSTVMRHVWGEPPKLEWAGASVVDDFAETLNMEQIAAGCSAVGFNTIPAWMRPFAVLSNGEQFRVDLARRLLELPDPVVVDEFTSVVDRQVAQIGSHAVQKFVRRNKRRFVAVTCHYDVIDWLQPDWVLDMATRSFTRRSLQRRPSIDCVVGRVPYAAWSLFAPFHYMTATLHRGARCFGLWVGDRLVAFSATMHMLGTSDITRLSRSVVLPDWQGLGLSQVLVDMLGAAYKGLGRRLRSYPAHPSLVRARAKSENWRLIKKPGDIRPFGDTSEQAGELGRPCATLEYVGAAMPKREAERLIGWE